MKLIYKIKIEVPFEDINNKVDKVVVDLDCPDKEDNPLVY